MSKKGIQDKTRAKILRVQKIRRDGFSVTLEEACRVVGISRAHYRQVMRKLKSENVKQEGNE